VLRPANPRRKIALRVVDGLAEDVGATLRLVSPSIKRGGAAAGISPSRFSRWQVAGRGNPVFDVAEFVHAIAQDRGARPGALVALLRSTIRRALMPTDHADLVARFHALMEEEAAVQGVTDLEQWRVRRTGDMSALRTRLREHAGVLEELDAVCAEIQSREINPYAKEWTR
jgi:hypothetical protein